MTQMRLRQEHGKLIVAREDGALAGVYVLDDPFKPHIHPLMSPSGRTVSLSIPHDHKHHKGLMYALRAYDVNFWEERSTLNDEQVGRQRQTSLRIVTEKGPVIGFEQELHWSADPGDLPCFNETRSITCSFNEETGCYVWIWATRLVSLREMELVKSQWSAPAADGRMINYHGLGLRFARPFGAMPRGTTLLIDGVETEFPLAMGARAKTATLIGSFDGEWPSPRAGVTITQAQSDALFALRDPFAFLSFGPTNAEPRRTQPGEMIEQSFTIEVFDAQSAAA